MTGSGRPGSTTSSRHRRASTAARSARRSTGRAGPRVPGRVRTAGRPAGRTPGRRTGCQPAAVCRWMSSPNTPGFGQFLALVAQLLDEVLRAAPVQGHPGAVEVVLQVRARAPGIDRGTLLGVDLDAHVRVHLTPLSAFGTHKAAVEDTEVPLVEAEAHEHQRRVRQAPTHHGRNEGTVTGDACEEVEEVVLGQHERLGLVVGTEQ